MVSSAEIRARLRNYFPVIEYALLFEVADGTGANKRRSADALAVSLWPSRGIEMHGIEIKVSRADFRTEMKDPSKADAIGKYCDKWWIACPKDMLKPDELPVNWGLLETFGDNSMRIKKQAVQREAAQIDRTFMAGLARSMGKMGIAEIEEAVRMKTNQMRESIRAEYDSRERRNADELIRLQKVVRDFEDASGVSIHTYADGRELGQKVKLARMLDDSSYSTMNSVRDVMNNAIKEIDRLVATVPNG